MTEPAKDTRDTIIGRLTVELEEERKLTSELLSQLSDIRKSLDTAMKLTFLHRRY